MHCIWLSFIPFSVLTILFETRFLRKISSKPGEWEDVGDIVAKEKASQVLRDAIQARKSFSKDGTKPISKISSLSVQSKRKRPPQEMKITSQQRPFRVLPKLPVSQWKNNGSLPLTYRSSNNVYSPAYSSVPRPFNSYGRVPFSNPGNPTEDVPIYSTTLLPHQYPVTPSNSSIAVSTAKKRQRLAQESPLTEGYHQYPYPTPMRSANAEKSPLALTSFSSPIKAHIRGLPFSPPTSEQNSDENVSSLRHLSTLHTPGNKHSAYEMVQTLPPVRQKSKAPPMDRNATNPQDLDLLLTHDVLSDSGSKNDSDHLFASEEQDDLVF